MSRTVLNRGDILIVAQHMAGSSMAGSSAEMVAYSATDQVTGLTETVICRADYFRCAQVLALLSGDYFHREQVQVQALLGQVQALLGEKSKNSETGVQNKLAFSFYPAAESVQPKAEELRWIP